MTVAILWLLRILFVYFIIRFVFSLFRSRTPKDHKKDFKKKDSVRRFDEKGKNISDGDFKDIG
jgi:hypothetical protein